MVNETSTSSSSDSESSTDNQSHCHLEQCKIIVEKKGTFDRKTFKLIVQENNELHVILAAVADRGIIFRKGDYKVYETSVDSKNDDSNPKSDFMAARDTTTTEIPSPAPLTRKISPATPILQDSIHQIRPDNDWTFMGKVANPGWFFDQSIVTNDGASVKSVIRYECTSRTGDLMRMQVAVPQVNDEPKNRIVRNISDSARIPTDCAMMIAEFVGTVHWSESLPEFENSDFKGLIDRNDVVSLHNKIPVWNPAINAYTLEFCGRALLPSVHNFQLIDDSDRVSLQLGKVSNVEFNMDYGYPLTAFQAFSICLSVILRTFVWD